MKCIIDIPVEWCGDHGALMVPYKVQDAVHWFNTGIDMDIESFDESEADKAWEFFKKLDAMSSEEWMECFEQKYIPGCFGDMSYTEAKAKYDAWQERKDELKIGDEVMHDAYRRCVLLEKKDIHEVELWSVIDEKGTVHQINGKHISRKTGRHFPQVAEVLEQMKEPE